MDTQCKANSNAVFHPPSMHMHLGRGISTKKMRKGPTCIEYDICLTSDKVYASLSESELFALFSDSGCSNQEIKKNATESSTRQENICTTQAS